jgi:signal transduction histidine kinase
MLAAIVMWFTGSGFGSERRAPMEVVFLRLLGLAYLVVFVVSTATTHPHPGLHGRGLVILLATIAFVVSALATQPRRSMESWKRIVALLVVTAASAALAALQPDGIWQAGPYFVGVVAAMRLERLAGLLTLGLSLVVLVAISVADGHGGGAVSVTVGAVPWFLVMRLMRETRDQQKALEASKLAQARAAATAERARLARDMHDVLAHSLSALALQLESTRLLADDRGADGELTGAIDRAHQLAVAGLEEARGAIAAARGDEMPGPERLGVLAEAFGEQSGVEVAVNVRGEPRELASDARLALYRTAQEALTNVGRHADAQRVDVQLEYGRESTVLVVEDRADVRRTPAESLSLSGGYGLTGMRERAELLGGELLAQPTEAGFRVELRLPA